MVPKVLAKVELGLGFSVKVRLGRWRQRWVCTQVCVINVYRWAIMNAYGVLIYNKVKIGNKMDKGVRSMSV